ncbi:hypothetical protein PS2_009407 [Malus domestica]
MDYGRLKPSEPQSSYKQHVAENPSLPQTATLSSSSTSRSCKNKVILISLLSVALILTSAVSAVVLVAGRFKASNSVASSAIHRKPTKAISDIDALCSAYDDCLELLDDSVDALSRALTSVVLSAASTSIQDLLTWLSAALTNQDTYREGFEQINGDNIRNEMDQRLKDLSELMSNCLAIYSAIGGDDFSGVPIHNKQNSSDVDRHHGSVSLFGEAEEGVGGGMDKDYERDCWDCYEDFVEGKELGGCWLCCFGLESLNVSVPPAVQTIDLQTLYNMQGWDSYIWAFAAEEDNAMLVFKNPGMEDDPTCGPIIDDVAIKKLFTPDRPKGEGEEVPKRVMLTHKGLGYKQEKDDREEIYKEKEEIYEDKCIFSTCAGSCA